MNKYIPKVNDTTYYLGVNDRTKCLFENLWPLPKGVSYNSYLIRDEKNVLIDTVDTCYAGRFFTFLERTLEGEPLHYLVINHMEPDHAGSIELLRNKYPEVQIVGNKKTLGMLQGYYGLTEGLVEVKEGEPLPIGKRELTFLFAPMVHWPEVMFTYDPMEKTLFSADAFGSFGAVDGGIFDEQVDYDAFLTEAYRYYSNIVGKYGGFTQKALEKASKLEIGTICPAHGPMWRAHLPEVLAQYERMSKYEAEEGVVIILGSMYGHTEEMGESIGRALAHYGVKSVVVHHLAKSHPSNVIADVFRYRGIIIGTPTYNNELWPPMASVLSQLASRQIPDRYYGVFGSGSWNPNVAKKVHALLEPLKWVHVGEDLEFRMSMSEEEEAKAWKLGKAMASAILKSE